MRCQQPPHTLGEFVDATVHILRHTRNGSSRRTSTVRAFCHEDGRHYLRDLRWIGHLQASAQIMRENTQSQQIVASIVRRSYACTCVAVRIGACVHIRCRFWCLFTPHSCACKGRPSMPRGPGGHEGVPQLACAPKEQLCGAVSLGPPLIRGERRRR